MQVLVIGAGVIGLAVARQAAQAGHEVIVAGQGPSGVSVKADSGVIPCGSAGIAGVEGRACKSW